MAASRSRLTCALFTLFFFDFLFVCFAAVDCRRRLFLYSANLKNGAAFRCSETNWMNERLKFAQECSAVRHVRRVWDCSKKRFGMLVGNECRNCVTIRSTRAHLMPQSTASPQTNTHTHTHMGAHASKTVAKQLHWIRAQPQQHSKWIELPVNLWLGWCAHVLTVNAGLLHLLFTVAQGAQSVWRRQFH